MIFWDAEGVCDRCGTPMRGSMLGYFTLDPICLECYPEEKQHPDYAQAVSLWETAMRHGDPTF